MSAFEKRLLWLEIERVPWKIAQIKDRLCADGIYKMYSDISSKYFEEELSQGEYEVIKEWCN